MRGNKCARVETKEQLTKMVTSSGSDYIPKGSGCGDSGRKSESLDTEPEFFDECVASKDREGSNRERRKRSTVMPKVEVVWQSFEERNLMDS